MTDRHQPDDSLASLSDGQKNCLRLVARGPSSKEIAIETGLTPHTVDTYIRQALARLGATNRREAARLLVAHEGSQELRSQPEAIVEAPAPAQQEATAGGRRLAASLMLPPLGGRQNELDPGARTLALIRVAALGATMLIAVTLLLAGVLETFR